MQGPYTTRKCYLKEAQISQAIRLTENISSFQSSDAAYLAFRNRLKGDRNPREIFTRTSCITSQTGGIESFYEQVFPDRKQAEATFVSESDFIMNTKASAALLNSDE